MNVKLAVGMCLMALGAVSQVANNLEREYGEQMPAEFANWEQWHMWVEHELDKDSYTSEVFFQLHTTSDPATLSKKDILRLYGVNREEVVGQGDGMGDHDNSELISPELKDKIIRKVLQSIDDTINDGQLRTEVKLNDWLQFKKLGGQLPDFGVGPGHEYGFEEEYEKHHWLKYHSDGDPHINDWHKEDIEHELLHHFHEIEHEGYEGSGYYAEKELLWHKIPNIFKF